MVVKVILIGMVGAGEWTVTANLIRMWDSPFWLWGNVFMSCTSYIRLIHVIWTATLRKTAPPEPGAAEGR